MFALQRIDRKRRNKKVKSFDDSYLLLKISNIGDIINNCRIIIGCIT